YPQEHFYFWDFLRLFITNLISDYFHAWHDGVFWSNITSIPIFRLMQFWGTYQGFRQQGKINNQLKETFYYPRRLSRQDDQSQLNQNRPIIDYSTQSKITSPK
ncbi:MAG: glycosyltransferase family 2 protein, partial [Crocosphaera sp.]|nr:glycosyltransferase family 2 protein [Crocosphaera sp.]